MKITSNLDKNISNQPLKVQDPKEKRNMETFCDDFPLEEHTNPQVAGVRVRSRSELSTVSQAEETDSVSLGPRKQCGFSAGTAEGLEA